MECIPGRATPSPRISPTGGAAWFAQLAIRRRLGYQFRRREKMMTIFLQGAAPATSSIPQMRTNWRSTMGQPVRCGPTDVEWWGLSDAKCREITAAHPGGAAHIWGSLDRARVERMQPGDLVLFVGDHHVHHIGQVGVTFHSPSFGRVYWQPVRGRAFETAYTLSSLLDLGDDYPTADVWEVVGYDPEWAVRGLTGTKKEQEIESYFADEIEAL